MKDNLQDKDLKIEEVEAKMNLLQQENHIAKESKEVMQRKIDHLYDNNILIAREGGSQTTNKEDENQIFMTNI